MQVITILALRVLGKKTISVFVDLVVLIFKYSILCDFHRGK